LADKNNTTEHLEKLLAQFRNGDQDSKFQIVEFSFKRFKKLAKRMIASYPLLRSKADTDDLLQNFLIRLTKAIESIIPNSSVDFFQLASVLMRNELIDMGRKLFGKDGAKKNFEQPTDPNLLDAKEPGDGPSGLLEWVEFHESIDKLPEEEKIVFQLIFYQEFTQDEVAELLGLSLKTVFRRWTKAKLILSDKFV
jgi:RNA polymerase sigma factor (sigma-70 family)